jgi:hypothetical protein
MAILVERFKRWLDKAEPGYEYPYHIGFIAIDRWDGPDRPNEIDDLAAEVYTAYEKGKVSLHQIRLYPEHRGFEYIARKRQPADKLFDLELPARLATTKWTAAEMVRPIDVYPGSIKPRRA